MRKAIRQLKQRCDDLQVHSISRSVHHVRQFSFSRQAQNDAAAAAAVGGGLEETLMGVEEYGACCAGSVFAGNGLFSSRYDKELAMLLRRNTDMLSQIKQDLRETKIALEAGDD